MMAQEKKSKYGMLLIPADIDAPIVYKKFPDNDFRGMAAAIGAEYIERVRVGPEEALLVDEEGLLTDKPLNVRASVLYGTRRHGQPIMGDALFGIEEMTVDGADWTNTGAPELSMRLQALFKAAEG